MSRFEDTAHAITGQVFSIRRRTAAVRSQPAPFLVASGPSPIAAFSAVGGWRSPIDRLTAATGSRQGGGPSDTVVAGFTCGAADLAHAPGASSAGATPGGGRPVDRDASVAAVSPSAYSGDA